MSAGHVRLMRMVRQLEAAAHGTQIEGAASRVAALVQAFPDATGDARRMAARAIRLLGRIARLERACGPVVAARLWAEVDTRLRLNWGPDWVAQLLGARPAVPSHLRGQRNLDHWQDN
jgi:hypothetical protein